MATPHPSEMTDGLRALTSGALSDSPSEDEAQAAEGNTKKDATDQTVTEAQEAIASKAVQNNSPPVSYAQAVGEENAFTPPHNRSDSQWPRVVSVNGEAFAAADVEIVNKLWNATCPSVSERRAVSDFEKRAIRGIFGGSVVVRATPDFFSIVFSSGQMVAFHSYLRDHV